MGSEGWAGMALSLVPGSQETILKIFCDKYEVLLLFICGYV